MAGHHGAPGPVRGRGAASNRAGRYQALAREPWDDGWAPAERPPPPATELTPDPSRSILSRNDSPDVPFDRSVNPYRGCEHGCVYCYARPSHAWLDLSPGLDFETRLLYKPRAPELLRAALARPGYRCAPLALGANTDPYQPAERRLGITRALLEVLLEARHPVLVTTRSALVERDLDLLAELAGAGLARVNLSVTTLDRDLARRMEPRAAAPGRRLEALARLAGAGVPAGVLFAPVIPMLNDPDLEGVLAAAREGGAVAADYVLLRLPHEVQGLFEEWLRAHYPLKADRVLERVRDCRAGALNDGAFGRRMAGTGVFASLIAQRFTTASRRLGYPGFPPLDCARFRAPPPDTPQMELFPG